MKHLRLLTLHLHYLPVSLLDDLQGLPHLPIAHEETIITIPRRSHGYLKGKILIAAIRRMHPHVKIDTRRPQIGPRKPIIQGPRRTDRARADRPLHKDAIPREHALELPQYIGIFGQKFLYLFKSRIGEITLETTDPTHIGRQPAPAHLLIDLID